MDTILNDLRLGARLLRKNPGSTLIAVVALSLGIGLTTMMFSIVYGALMRGLPFDEPDRIVAVLRNNPSRDIERMGVPIHDLLDWREQQTLFAGLSGFYTGTVNIAGTETPERYDGGFMMADAFRVLGVQPLLGRTFRDGEDQPGAEPVIILGHEVWQNRYGGDAGIVGQVIRVNGRAATIIGVMPEGFTFPASEQVWVPLPLDPLQLKRGDGTQLTAFGRLQHGVSIDQAQLELSGIARRLALEYPQTNEGVGVITEPYTQIFIGREPALMLYTMLAAVFLVLLIACINVANLLLSRAALRGKEVGIRSALGATRLRVIVQFLAESLVLALGAAVVGLGIAWVGVRLFNMAIADTQPPFWIDIRVDLVAIGFVLAVALLAALVAGAIPAIQASRSDVSEILKDETRGSSSFRLGWISRGLVALEIAFSIALLIGAGLMVKSVVQLRNINPGFATTDVFTARLGLFDSDYPDDAARTAFFEELLQRLRGIPGVREATLTTNLPGLGTGIWRIEIDGRTYESEQDAPRARRGMNAPGFFDTFGAQLLQGRDFNAQDRADALPVAIINQSFARRLFGGEDPIGRRFREYRAPDPADPDAEPAPWLTVVGVAPDMQMEGIGNPDADVPEGYYVPLAQNTAQFVSIAARTLGEPMALTQQVRHNVVAVDANLPIYFVRSLEESIQRNTWFYRIFGVLFMIFGLVALFLASVGLYGVVSFSVSRRTRELGIRRALGASDRDILGLIMRQGTWQLVAGGVLGLGIAFLLAKGLAIVLYRVEPSDPLVFGSIVLLLGAVAMLASFVPARRATLVDPMESLRYE